MAHFAALTREEQLVAIRRLKAEGKSDDVIASATQLSVEFVRRIVGAAKSEAPAVT